MAGVFTASHAHLDFVFPVGISAPSARTEIITLVSHPRFQIWDFGGGKLREGEAFPAEVFQRCTDEIQSLVINDEKTVVEVLAFADG